MEELKPCPFCGSKIVEVLPKERYLINQKVKFKEPVAVVECMTCFATVGFYRIGVFGDKGAKLLAIEAWNRRIDAQAAE